VRTDPIMRENHNDNDFFEPWKLQESWERKGSRSARGIGLIHEINVSKGQGLDRSDIGFDGAVTEPSATL
jgi:hypothetical protein